MVITADHGNCEMMVDAERRPAHGAHDESGAVHRRRRALRRTRAEADGRALRRGADVLGDHGAAATGRNGRPSLALDFFSRDHATSSSSREPAMTETRTTGGRSRRLGVPRSTPLPCRCAACDAPLERDGDLFCGGCRLTLAPLDSACRDAPPVGGAPASGRPVLGCLQRPPRFDAAVAGSSSAAPSPRPSAAPSGTRCRSWPRRSASCSYRALCARAARLRRGRRDRAGAAPSRGGCARASSTRRRSWRLRCAKRRARAMRRSAASRSTRRALERTRDTPPQTGLDAAQRRRNVYDAFRVRAARARSAAGASCSSTTS